MDIRIFFHREPDLISGDIAQITERLATAVLNDFESDNPSITLTISPKELDDRAQFHADKWVEETALHMQQYADAPRPMLTQPTGNVPQQDQRLIINYKSISGDVSGVIGEALFSLLLVKHFQLDGSDFAHLRADKTSGFYPDFGIYQLSNSLQQQLNWDGNSIIGLSVPAEVKTISKLEKSQLKPKLRKATEQIRNYWLRQNGTGASIVCVAARNTQIKSYDVTIIWGR
jgi:hypothetical protein